MRIEFNYKGYFGSFESVEAALDWLKEKGFKKENVNLTKGSLDLPKTKVGPNILEEKKNEKN